MLKRHKSTISREVGHNRGGLRLPPPCQPCPHAHLSDNGKEFFHHQVVAEGAQRRWPLRSPLPFLRARAQREHQRTHSPIPAQRHGLPDAHTRGGPGHHGQTQQPAPQMPWLQDAQSGILWDQTTYCTSELNPRGLFYYLLV